MAIKKALVSVLFLLIMMLVGCTADQEKKDLLDEELAHSTDSPTSSTSTYNNGDLGQAEEFTSLSHGEALMQTPEFSDPNSPLSKRTIYFEYDSSQILNSFFPIIEAHAQYLMRHPNQRIVLEGHSDERGTREYNIALAEQRAQSVFKMMKLIGVMSNQVDIVSYGEEKPVAIGNDEKSYALNRRVELVYK